MKQNVEKWRLTSGDLRANFDETNEDLADMFKQQIDLNVNAGKFTTYELPDKIIAMEREHVRLLPSGAKVLMGKFPPLYNPNIVIIHSTHLTVTECKYGHLTSRQ